jgi:signal transduction histidine kinase/ActR/RegA family two-component response regulator
VGAPETALTGLARKPQPAETTGMAEAQSGASDPSAEIARLREENRALDERVKLLVQTEQRLYGAQADVDRQLERMQSLSQLALECAALDDPREILARGARLLITMFHADSVVAILGDAASGTVVVVPEAGPLPAEVVADACRALPALVEKLRRRDDGRRLDERPAWLTALVGPATPDRLLLLPVRPSEHQHGLIVLERSAGKASIYRQPVSAQHHPFLELLALHLERAIERASLTSALRARTQDLEQANANLARTVQSLGQAQDQLVHARKMEAIGRLSGGLAHEFNNLLTVILTYTELARASVAPDAAERANLESVIDAAQRAAAITRQLLALSRRQPQRREAVDLNDLAATMARMLARLIGEHVDLRLDLDPKAHSAWADRGQMEQVLLNLVLNARDAMPGGGRLAIATRPAAREDLRGRPELGEPSGFVALVVSDTGVGMDENARAHLFEPFFTTKGSGKGTGLGLAVVYSIVTQTGGHIDVRSESGHGSHFTILLPVASARTAPVRVAVARGADAARAVVLLVEDEDGIRHGAERVLGGAGYRVVPAADGAEALRLVEQDGVGFDVLVSDVVMPNLGGVGLATALAARRPSLPLVLMSGYPTDDIDPRLGAQYLQKPFTSQQLLAAVTKALGDARDLTAPSP